MVYEWDQHKDVCYKLYIQERKSLEDIMHHMRDTYNFTPSKRAYQTQFRRWGFPSKQNPAHRNVDLVARVKQLWEQNYTQRDMLNTLNQEGYEIKERELMRVRAKNRWLLRIPNGMKPTAAEEPLMSDFHAQLLEAAVLPNGDTGEAAVTDSAPQPAVTSDGVTEVVQIKRKERQDQLQAESDERWASRKRRRRTRDYAGIPADPPGPPRFPSETTLDESKQFLSLDTKQYREVRQQFQSICEEEGIIKKTIAGTEKWQAAKERLVRENEPLRLAFSEDPTNTASKELALDVVCTDVTKRIRTLDTRMTIAGAKNILGINPEQSRQIRNTFYTMLQADHFTSKLEIGREHWDDLKKQWIAKTPILQEILADGEADPQHEEKSKALEVLCRDVMKRLRDDQTRKKDGSSQPKANKSDAQSQAARTAAAANDMVSLQQSGATINPYQFASQELEDLQIDPSLLQAADETTAPPPAQPTAVYIRSHPKSQMHNNEKMWLASLATRTVQELKTMLSEKWSDSRAVRIDGVEKDGNGQDISYLIEEDDELDAYLDHVQGRKAVFVVQLIHA